MYAMNDWTSFESILFCICAKLNCGVCVYRRQFRFECCSRRNTHISHWHEGNSPIFLLTTIAKGIKNEWRHLHRVSSCVICVADEYGELLLPCKLHYRVEENMKKKIWSEWIDVDDWISCRKTRVFVCALPMMHDPAWPWTYACIAGKWHRARAPASDAANVHNIDKQTQWQKKYIHIGSTNTLWYVNL